MTRIPPHVPRSYDEALQYLHSFYRERPPDSVRARVSQEFVSGSMLAPVRAFPRIVQVTGTNGKGSTCAFLEALLLTDSRPVVTVTSPHLRTIRERVRVAGEAITPQMFVDVLRDLYPELEAVRNTELHPLPTQLVFWMALAVHHRLGPDYTGIYEVGKGGRTDSTNVFDESVVVLTSIAEDHLAEFGGTLLSLAEEKLGLCRPGGILVHAPLREEVQRYVEHRSRQLRLQRLEVAAEDPVPAVTHGMRGEWQAGNFALACMAFRAVTGGATPPALHDEVGVPGRLEERILGDRRVVLDVAHNPDSLGRLMEVLQRDERAVSRAAIIGFSDDRPWQGMISTIVNSGLFTVFACTSSCRGHPLEPNLMLASGLFPSGLAVARQSLKSALEWVLATECAEIFIFGSCYLVADYDRALYSLGLGEFAQDPDSIDSQQSWMRALA